MISSYVLLFDIDGVIADWSAHYHLINQGKHDEYYAAVANFPVLPAGATVYNLLATQCRLLGNILQQDSKAQSDIPFVDIVTCRPEKMRATTLTWLTAHGMIMPRNLHMRADDDRRPHAQIKLDMYRQFYEGKEAVICLFEDNLETIKVFQAAGVPCCLMMNENESASSIPIGTSSDS